MEIVKILVESKANVNICDYYDTTALHIAAWRGKLEIVKYLVEHGAKVNIRDKENNTPLDMAEKVEQPEIVKYLKAHGAVRGESASGKAIP